jgi:hypothetical protein
MTKKTSTDSAIKGSKPLTAADAAPAKVNTSAPASVTPPTVAGMNASIVEVGDGKADDEPVTILFDDTATATASTSTSTAAPATAAAKKGSKAASTSNVTPTQTAKRAPVVPTDPPKTLYELERVGRGLKNRPDLLAQYLSTFKKSTFKAAFKEALSPELLSATMVSLRDFASPTVAVTVLEGLASTASFHMIKILLDEGDWSNVEDILNRLEDAAKSDAKVDAALPRLISNYTR